MLHKERVCIFVDGENLRHSIGDLFPQFDRKGYLPNADWGKFFDWVATEAVGEDADRIRTYWYAVQDLDFSPFNLRSLLKDEAMLEKILSKNELAAKEIKSAPNKSAVLKKIAGSLIAHENEMRNRFGGWHNMQDDIAHQHKAVEFRRAGAIRYHLFERQFGSEKAVDVKLATDLIKLKDIYDTAIILSGDQDYTPAISAIKDFGKRTVNVAFETEEGRLLPGGARRLNQTTDWSINLDHKRLKKYLGL